MISFVLVREKSSRPGSSKFSPIVTAAFDNCVINCLKTRYHFFFRCEFDKEPCYPEDFTTTFTDFGVCYTFNSKSGDDSKVVATETGTMRYK